MTSCRRSPSTDGVTTRRPVSPSREDRRRSATSAHFERRSPRSASTTACEMVGSVSAAVLAAHYRTADVFVCLSDHEGFCVPLLEAMHHRLPIVAFAATAVPETLASGGLCLPDKEPAAVAARGVARVDRGCAARPSRAGGRAAGSRLRPDSHGRDLHVGHHRARSASRRESDPPVPPDARSR